MLNELELRARPLLWDELVEGMQAKFEFAVSREEMRAFQVLSGDFNPLHCDDEFARRKGFEESVVFGALLAAKVSGLIGMELPGRDSLWTKLVLDFHKPLYVGQLARLEGVVSHLSAATRNVSLALSIHRGGDLIAKGKAEVRLV